VENIEVTVSIKSKIAKLEAQGESQELLSVFLPLEITREIPLFVFVSLFWKKPSHCALATGTKFLVSPSFQGFVFVSVRNASENIAFLRP
jgi:hypothetical protein